MKDMYEYEYQEFFYHRLTQLRMAKGVSAREMSLALGQSNSYINSIENRKSLPSMTVFFNICVYLGITPQQFFDMENQAPAEADALLQEIKKLRPDQIATVLAVVRSMRG